MLDRFTKKQKVVLVFIAVVVVMAFIWAFIEENKAFGQEMSNFSSHTSVMSFDLNNVKKSTVESACFFNQGVWVDMEKKRLPKTPARITSGYVCKTGGQIIGLQRDDTEYHMMPKYYDFVFDHFNELDYVVYWYEYSTWAAREYGKQSFVRNKKLHFKEPLLIGINAVPGSSKIGGLNNLKYLSSVSTNEEHVFKLGIMVSREPYESYK